jgi:hypothetical protein
MEATVDGPTDSNGPPGSATRVETDGLRRYPIHCGSHDEKNAKAFVQVTTIVT